MLITALFGTLAARQEEKQQLTLNGNLSNSIKLLDQRFPNANMGCEDAPVFILSAGWRSGSTLLQRMLMNPDERMIWGEPIHRASIIQTLSDQLRCFSSEWPRETMFQDDSVNNLSELWVADLSPSVKNMINAHRAYLQTLFNDPAKSMGKSNWGLKEVRLTAEHAVYLKWLFPKSKIIFLYRNPFDAYASFRNYLISDYSLWPNNPVYTASHFGKHWHTLVHGFLKAPDTVDGFLLKYEDLFLPDTHQKLEEYLNFSLTPIAEMKRISGRSGNEAETQVKSKYIPKLEKMLLKRKVGTLSKSLGYDNP
jgi:hypothetical protein